MKTLRTIIAAATVAITLPALAENSAVRKFPAAPKCAKCNVVNVKGAVANAKRVITYRLRDPESVRWRMAKVDPYGNVCIEVNARNGFGGYTGFTVWAVDASGLVLEGSYCFLRNATVVSAN